MENEKKLHLSVTLSETAALIYACKKKISELCEKLPEPICYNESAVYEKLMSELGEALKKNMEDGEKSPKPPLSGQSK
jgi:hypothetical protein